MKRLILIIIGVGVLAGLGLYAIRPKEPVSSAAESATEGAAVQPDPEPPAPAQTESVQPTQPMPVRSEPAPALLPKETNSSKAGGFGSTKSAVDASIVARAVETLVSPQSSHQQRRDVWKQLSDTGKLDPAIAELERMASDSRSAESAAALGQAYLQKCRVVKDVREQGILAMQADKSFDTALSLDPANWEARFTKAVAMSYWPSVLNKGEEVIQHFQILIEQQEAQAQQAQFAESYSWLGDQYQKAGRTNDAIAVWQRGAGLFPTDEKLRGKLGAVP